MIKKLTVPILLCLVSINPEVTAAPATEQTLTTTRPKMTDEEFEVYLDSALAELSEKQDRLTTDYGIGKFARWHFDQSTEKLEFFDGRDRKVLEAAVVEIGSYSHKSDSWKWAWANESVLPSLRKKAEPLRELRALTGLPLFTIEPAFSLNRHEIAWKLVAMSAQHLDALGVYKAPSDNGNPVTFLAIMEIEMVQE